MAKRKAPPRASKKDPWSLDELLTSRKSKLIDLDLHAKLAAFFSNLENWAEVPEEDKQFIRSLLPPYVELNDDGSIPTEFWKYNSEFRLDCRNLQEDLRTGRMDPEWQRQAHQAMEERAAGKFDDFKEREFEEFWGQKQKVDWTALAGDASKVKLEDMLTAGLFKLGDVWTFDHTFGRGEEAVRIWKDCRIVRIDGKTITLAIPPGTLRFARRLDGMASTETNPVEVDPPELEADAAKDQVDPPEEHKNRLRVQTTGESSHGVTNPPHQMSAERSTPQLGKQPSTTELSAPGPASSISEPSPSPTKKSNPNLTSSTTGYDVILFSATGLLALEKKILAIDGRAKPGARTGSPWRDIRCYRDEQDMGSLFEMREEFYVYHVAEGDYQTKRISR
ncbi:MAG: hypothetical protein Q9201_007642 [Fulgogasparrea decipioides]